MNPIQRMIADNIQKYGLAIQYIFPTCESDGPSFIYTVGLTDIGKPEWIAFGLPPEVMMPILNEMFVEIREGARDAEVSEIADVANVVFRNEAVDIREAKKYAVQAFEYYKGTGMVPQFRQLIWPDEQGIYPDQPGFSERLKPIQPYLPGRPKLSKVYDADSFDK